MYKWPISEKNYVNIIVHEGNAIKIMTRFYFKPTRMTLIFFFFTKNKPKKPENKSCVCKYVETC